MTRPSSIRGQTSMEFTVILAVVLIIGLMVIGLGLFFGMGSSDVSDTDAKTYWATQVRPLRISEMAGYYYTTSNVRGEIALKIENVDSKPITIKGITLGSVPYLAFSIHSADGIVPATTDSSYLGSATASGGRWTKNLTVSPGEQITVYIRAPDACTKYLGGLPGSSTERFKNNVTFYYETPDIVGLTFKGVKPIKGACSPT